MLCTFNPNSQQPLIKCTLSYDDLNDIVVLLTLIIALIAIINEENRAHLLLKLTKLDIFLFAVALVLINYFVFYRDFEQKGWVINALFFNGLGLHQPKHYAYVITLGSLIYLFYKIYRLFYANTQIEKVSVFYNKQIENQELSFLIDLIEQYHKKDIIRWVSKSPDAVENPESYLEIYQKEPWYIRLRNWTTIRIAKLFPTSWYNCRNYAHNVLNFTVNSPGFICHAAKVFF